VVVESDAEVSGVIADECAILSRGCRVGLGESVPSEERPASLSCGATVLAMNVRLPAGTRVGKNCLIHSDASEADIGGEVPSGKSVWPRDAGRQVES